MYGEKAEQAEELRMDLEDVKSMYKSQVYWRISDYLKRLNCQRILIAKY